MVRCCDLLDLTIHRKYNEMVVEPLARLVDFYWVGIGEWKA